MLLARFVYNGFSQRFLLVTQEGDADGEEDVREEGLALLFEEVSPGARIIALPLALVVATVGPLVSYYNSDKIILKMSKARPSSS